MAIIGAKAWENFFSHTDALPEWERADYYDLLHRNFAAIGAPSMWPGFDQVDQQVQKRLNESYLAWCRQHDNRNN